MHVVNVSLAIKMNYLVLFVCFIFIILYMKHIHVLILILETHEILYL
jgi:hypothetical protein